MFLPRTRLTLPLAYLALVTLAGCRQPRVVFLDAALQHKAESKVSFPEALNAWTPQLPKLLATVDAEAERRGLQGWPEPWTDWWAHNGPTDPLLKKVWANPQVIWFCDPFMSHWDAVLVMKPKDEKKDAYAYQVVSIEDAFGPNPRFSTLFESPRSLPSNVLTWSHPAMKDGTWTSSDRPPAWALAPYVYPMQTAVLTTPVDVDWFMRFVYTPKLGVAVWGAWGMVSKDVRNFEQGEWIGEDEYFIWRRLNGLAIAQPKNKEMDQMKGPSFLGWTEIK